MSIERIYMCIVGTIYYGKILDVKEMFCQDQDRYIIVISSSGIPREEGGHIVWFCHFSRVIVGTTAISWVLQ